MKNSIKLFILAAITTVAVSCENKPSTVSYTLGGRFDYILNNPESFPVIDSIYYARYVMMDNYSALCTSSDEENVNSGFEGGWKISMKKGGLQDDSDLQLITSAGRNAGLTDANGSVNNKTYAVWSPSMLEYDILFNYKNFFTKTSVMVQGLYINNTKFVEKLAEDGNITDGDFLKVTAKFFKNDIPVAKEDFYLVDYTGAEKKIVKDWTAWEMKDASRVESDAIKFEVTSNFGTLPSAFCMDLLVASVSIEY
ncbi:MAG TPA: hypothetical protein DDX40_00180 [Rikenellaceae bacterium]|nr:hypothetical protein [Rikenellaceae bacterium]